MKAGKQAFSHIADWPAPEPESPSPATEVTIVFRQIADTYCKSLSGCGGAPSLGVAATGKAGESLNQIILAAEGVGDTVSQIATAASEQSNATEQVNSSMDQINNLAAESAEGARQSAQACQQLSGLALELKKTVEKFKIGPRRLADENGAVWTDREAAPAPRAFAAAASANSDRYSGA